MSRGARPRATRCLRACGVGARRRGEDRLGAIAIATPAAGVVPAAWVGARERREDRRAALLRERLLLVLDLFFPLLLSSLELSGEKDSWKLR